MHGERPGPKRPGGQGAVRRRGLAVAILLAGVLAAYGNSVGGGFVWLDHIEIEQGGYRVRDIEDARRVRTLTLDAYLERDLGDVQSRGGYWRPIYALSISLDWALWGARPWAYHAENIAWHVAAVLGLYLLGLRLLRGRPGGEGVALLAALLFAVHPLGVHSVTWISGRKDAMCGALSVWALLGLARAGEARRLGAAAAWCLASFVLLALALGSKELAMVTPAAALLLLVRWGTGNGRSGPPGVRKRAMMAALGLQVLAVAALVTYRVTKLGGFGLNARRPADTILANIATSAALMWQYTSCVLLPRHPVLSDAWAIADGSETGSIVAVAALVIAAVFLGWATYRRWTPAAGLWWYVIWLIPASGVVGLRHFRAERYLYPASWGLLLAAACTGNWLWRRIGKGRALAWARVAMVGVIAWPLAITVIANRAWYDDRRLFEDAVKRDARHAEAWLGLAKLALDDEDYALTIDRSRRGIEAGQDSRHTAYWPAFAAYTNLGLALYHKKRAAEAAEAFDRALVDRPNNAIGHYHADLARYALKQFRRARAHYLRSVELNGGDYLCRSNLGATYLELGELGECVRLLGPLVEQRPDDPINRTNLAWALMRLSRFEEAAQHYEWLSRSQPRRAGHWARLAWCQLELGRPEEGRRTWRKAKALQGDHPAVRFVGGLLARKAGGRP